MNDLLMFILVGFCAQIIDGALDMAYGVSSNAFLLSFGINPVVSSASVHFAEIFTTLVSGISHLKFGNVDKKLFKKLVIPGIIGGVLGAYILTSISGKVIKPFISAYLLLMGIRILYKAIKKLNENSKKLEDAKKISILAVIGGFFDAIGGGGMGANCNNNFSS